MSFSKYLILFLYLVLNQILQCNSQATQNQIQDAQANTSQQNNQPAQNNNNTQDNQNAVDTPSVQISDEQLNSFSYGSEKFRLAVIGDSGTEREAKDVMELTSFDALLHLGDFDYKCTPDKYFNTILDSHRSYQFMGILGNHEGAGQCGAGVNLKYVNNVYHEMVGNKNDDIDCEFSSSRFMWSCVYKNMRIIGLSVGVDGADKRDEQLAFLKKHLREAKEDWKVCSWHFYDRYYHTGKYQSENNIISGYGESFYDYCKQHGAIIFSAHDHVYARTHVMSEFSSRSIDKHDGDTPESIVQIREGATFNILNGAGGYEMYEERGEQKDYPHWQIKYARGDNGENAKRYGGLFCDFNVDGNPRKAYCEFLRINSSKKLFDSFHIYRNDDPESYTYTKIDDDYKNEKLIAYKIANHIPLNQEEATEASNNNITSKINNGNDNKRHKNKGKIFNKTNIAIGCSIFALVGIVGAAILIINNRRKGKFNNNESLAQTLRKEEENIPNSTTFKNISNDKPFNGDQDIVDEIDVSAAPLPTPEGITYFQKDNKDTKNKHSSLLIYQKQNKDYLNEDTKRNNNNNYSKYDKNK